MLSQCLERNVTEYYYGKLENVDGPETCRYRGYGADADSEHNDYRKWQVLATQLAFVIVFEVRMKNFKCYYKLTSWAHTGFIPRQLPL